MRKLIQIKRLWAVTLLELMVVVMIISILATIATGVYTGETRRARIAASRDLIHSLSVAITRYEVDTGSLPPSGSGAEDAPVATFTGRVYGSGYLHMALTHGIAASPNTVSKVWKGPYLSFQAENVGPRVATDKSKAGMIEILDSWAAPVLYVNHDDYIAGGANFNGGTNVFTSGAVPAGANPDLPAPFPFTETYYNPSTYQLISFGPNGKTLGSTSTSTNTPIGPIVQNKNYIGAEADDINNFGY